MTNSRPSPFALAMDSVMAQMAANLGDNRWTQAPVYQYGVEFYNTTLNSCPQVRVKLADGNVGGQDRQRAGFGIKGSLFVWEQQVTIQVYGESEQQCFEVTSNLLNAYSQTTLSGSSTNDISETVFNWREDLTGMAKKGKIVEFELGMPVGVPNTPRSVAIVTAFSGTISGSVTANLTGSTYLIPGDFWIGKKLFTSGSS